MAAASKRPLPKAVAEKYTALGLTGGEQQIRSTIRQVRNQVFGMLVSRVAEPRGSTDSLKSAVSGAGSVEIYLLASQQNFIRYSVLVGMSTNIDPQRLKAALVYLYCVDR